MADERNSNTKKRGRDGEAVSSSSPSQGVPETKSTSKTERNRKSKLKKRAKKQTAEAKVQRRAERKRQDKKRGSQNGEDGDADREEMAALMLDDVQVGEQDANPSTALPPAKRSRDFCSDLKLYLDQWQAHQRAIETQNTQALQYSPWKFNKVLQAWALDHCLQRDRLSLDLFKQLLLYIASVRGGARERLRESMIAVIQAKEALSDTDEEIATEVKRAKKVLITIGKSDSVVNNQ